MALNGGSYRDRAVDAFQPVSEMLNVGRCEPMKAAVHCVLLVTVTVCAAYNAAAWLKRRQRHLAFNAVIYGVAVWWERAHVLHHLVCVPSQRTPVAGPDGMDSHSGPSATGVGNRTREAA
jgi:hypothetical protein